MTAKKKTSKKGPSKNDGKVVRDLDQVQAKMTAKDETKYTLHRTKEDINKIEKVRNQLKNSNIGYCDNRYKADSKIYTILIVKIMNLKRIKMW